MTESDPANAVERVLARAREILAGTQVSFIRLEPLPEQNRPAHRSGGTAGAVARPPAPADEDDEYDEDVEDTGPRDASEPPTRDTSVDAPPGFVPYVEAHLSAFSVWGPLGQASDRTLHPMILHILDVEAPVHFETVLERLRVHYGLGRAREPTRQHVARSIERLVATHRELHLDRVDAGTDFFLSVRDREVVPRSPGMHGTRRILHIAPAEIRAGVLAVLTQERSCYRDELIRMVREAFGYRRTGGDIHSIIDTAIDHLLRGGTVEESFGSLRLSRA
jgi:hypothetical protein